MFKSAITTFLTYQQFIRFPPMLRFRHFTFQRTFDQIVFTFNQIFMNILHVWVKGEHSR